MATLQCRARLHCRPPPSLEQSGEGGPSGEGGGAPLPEGAAGEAVGLPCWSDHSCLYVALVREMAAAREMRRRAAKRAEEAAATELKAWLRELRAQDHMERLRAMDAAALHPVPDPGSPAGALDLSGTGDTSRCQPGGGSPERGGDGEACP